jgi:hypothetical protein
MGKKTTRPDTEAKPKTPSPVDEEERWRKRREEALAEGVIVPEAQRLDMFEPPRIERYLRAIDNHTDEETAAILAGLHPDWVQSWLQVGANDARCGDPHEREVLNADELERDPEAEPELGPVLTLAQFWWATMEAAASREERLLSRLDESADDRWAAWILERIKPQRYARTQTVKQQVSGAPEPGAAPVRVAHEGSLPACFILMPPPLDDE